MADLTKGLLPAMVAIIATGVVLNVAGSGMLGAQVQKLAQYVTKGYGV